MAHRLTAIEAEHFLADAYECLTRRDRVAMLYGILSRDVAQGGLTDIEAELLGNLLGRLPHERIRT